MRFDRIQLYLDMKTKVKKKVKKNSKTRTPNALTRKTIEDAHNRIGIEGSITDLRAFMESL